MCFLPPLLVTTHTHTHTHISLPLMHDTGACPIGIDGSAAAGELQPDSHMLQRQEV